MASNRIIAKGESNILPPVLFLHDHWYLKEKEKSKVILLHAMAALGVRGGTTPTH
jgi:hypothetical protein